MGELKVIEDIEEMYLDELKAIKKKGELTPADGQAAKLAMEAIQIAESICCNEEEKEMGYSERMYPRRSMNRSYNDRPYRDRSMMPEMRPYDYDDYSERRGRSSTTGRYISRHGSPDYDNEVIDSIIMKLENMKNH